MMQNRPTVVITKFTNWTYFQWFLLGFYELERAGKIKLKFKTDWITNVSTKINNKKVISGLRKLFKYKVDMNLYGYIKDNGVKKYFCIDNADAPFLFDSEALDQVSVYFKMQCPKIFDANGFSLTSDVSIPYSDYSYSCDVNENSFVKQKRCTNLFDNLSKVSPLMVGCRQLAEMKNSYKALRHGYDNYIESRCSEPSKKVMSYFGNALGPEPSECANKIDANSESDIMGYFVGKIEHPNEKRSKASQILNRVSEENDARVISENFADSKEVIKNDDIVVPLDKFCEHISHFQYNLNISGYRMSIPNRFIESFIVGTAILTDKLFVRWYLPFEEEVIETVEMGYKLNNDIDWSAFEEDLKKLPTINKKSIIDSFERKWSPIVVANYILNTILKA